MSSHTPVDQPTVSTPSWDDYRLLVESVVDYAIFLLDLEGRVTTWNPGAKLIKGYQAEEIIGQHFSRFYPAEDVVAGKPARELDIAAREGRVEDEGWRVRKDGTRFWASVVITALRDDAGRLRGFGKVTRDMTARKAAEERARRAEQKFHHLVDAVIDYAIFMLDETGRVSTWNPGARRLKGYAADEIIGQHFSIFYTAEDRTAGKPEKILEAVRREGRYEDESWRVRKDGSLFWANVVITALRDEHGELRGFAKVTRDLTSRREAEETERRLLTEQTARDAAKEGERRLRESEARYRALSARLEIVLEGVADGITLQDRRGKVVFANGEAARFCGFDSGSEMMQTPPEEISARFELFDREGQPLAREQLPAQRVLAGEKAASALIHVRERSTGRDWWIQLRASPVLDAEGKPELAVNIWHDVTIEHLREIHARYLADATAALGSSLVYEEMLSTLGRILVPGLGDWCSIYLLEDGRLRDIARTHADPDKIDAVTRYQQQFPPDPGRSRGLWNVVRTGVVEVINDITDEMLARSASSPKAYAALRALGVRAAMLVPIRDRAQILGVIALVSSETERRYGASDITLAEELGRRAGAALENAQLYQRAQEAARSAEHAASAAEEASRIKDEFLATVSHELRTPLSAILGWATLLKDRLKEPSAKKPIEVIHRNAQAQVKIIDDILDVSRVITGKLRIDPRPSDLVAIARDAIEVVRPSADAKKIKLEFEPESDSCLLVADPERLQQVVWNLLSNAVKFTDPGGKARLSVGMKNSQVVLVVSDTGKGIEPAFLPLVFERFRQADSSTTRRVGGLGLGLALVRH
ncbi:MAG TPA: PAS domain S-box protein, partial [Polyangiaceae bacterium]|nr:PAS domain S-box protein [Polyangiaceae bacterium]